MKKSDAEKLAARLVERARHTYFAAYTFAPSLTASLEKSIDSELRLGDRCEALHAELDGYRQENMVLTSNERSAIKAHNEMVEKYTPQRKALRSLVTVVDEFCDAVDNATDDIGGGRSQREILADMGPAVEQAKQVLGDSNG